MLRSYFGRCHAHIINLATQAFLAAHSKSHHYDPSSPEETVVENRGTQRDEVGLVRAICIKVQWQFQFSTYITC